jgi:hypothetical protein
MLNKKATLHYTAFWVYTMPTPDFNDTNSGQDNTKRTHMGLNTAELAN